MSDTGGRGGVSDTIGSPPTVPVGDRPRLEDHLRDAEGLVIATDFDGTLAPITEDPSDAAIPFAGRRALASLSTRPDTRVAVVSGRELADLRSRVGVDDIRYAGNHGLEVDHGGSVTVHPASEERRPTVDAALADIGDRVGHLPGVELEDKELTATVHYRRAAPEHHPEIQAAVTDVVETAEGIERSSGKSVYEVRPAVDWNKGSALELLAADAPAGWRTVYVGDDTTDEDAFGVLGPDDAGVHVGESDTDATHRVTDRRNVPALLDWLATCLLGDRP